MHGLITPPRPLSEEDVRRNTKLVNLGILIGGILQVDKNTIGYLRQHHPDLVEDLLEKLGG